MEIVSIQAEAFFEIIKLKDTSMWDLFSNMIDGTEKHLVFLNSKNQVLFDYILPKNLEDLKQNQSLFTKVFSEKLEQNSLK